MEDLSLQNLNNQTNSRSWALYVLATTLVSSQVEYTIPGRDFYENKAASVSWFLSAQQQWLLHEDKEIQIPAVELAAPEV